MRVGLVAPCRVGHKSKMSVSKYFLCINFAEDYYCMNVNRT